MHAGGACFDHALHQFERIQDAAEPGFSVRDDRLQPVDRPVAFGCMDLVGAQQRVVDAPNDRRHGIRGIQGLIRIHLTGEVCIARNLPAREVDRIQTRPHLLHRLVAGQGAEGVDERLLVDVLPQLLGAKARKRILDVHRPAQPHDVFSFVRPLDALPAGIGLPVFPKLLGGGASHGRVLFVDQK